MAVKNKIYSEVWLSLVERCVRDAEAAGSSPVTSTKALKAKAFGALTFHFSLFTKKSLYGFKK